VRYGLIPLARNLPTNRAVKMESARRLNYTEILSWLLLFSKTGLAKP